MANKRHRLSWNGTDQAPIARWIEQNYGNAIDDVANGVLTTVATGFDFGQSNTKTKSKRKKIKNLPGTLAHGWYCDQMSGVKHEFPKSWNSVLMDNQKQRVQKQTPVKQDAVLSGVNHVQLLNQLQLSDLQAITDPGRVTYLLNSYFKIMFTNMSNVKLCYEYYYVTPVGDQAATFLENIVSLSSSSLGMGGVDTYDRFTTWTPQQLPELMKNYRILSKSVFRLAPGETGELHGKSNHYKKIGDAIQTTDRTYGTGGLNVQLYCRWYGCPTGTVDNLAPGTVTQATFGDALLATSWITEESYNYCKGDAANVSSVVWSSTVLETVPAGNTIVTHAQTDDDVTGAE